MVQTAPARSAKDLEAETAELVRNGDIIHPGLPAINLAEILAKEADPEFNVELGRMLIIRHYTQTIKAERRKAHPPEPPPALFPGLDELPRRILTPEGKRPLLEKSTTSQLRAYLKTINKRHRQRIAQLKAVLKMMGKYSRKKRGITVSQVADLEAKKKAGK